jgi:hypothetical protein
MVVTSHRSIILVLKNREKSCFLQLTFLLIKAAFKMDSSSDTSPTTTVASRKIEGRKKVTVVSEALKESTDSERIFSFSSEPWQSVTYNFRSYFCFQLGKIFIKLLSIRCASEVVTRCRVFNKYLSY